MAKRQTARLLVIAVLAAGGISTLALALGATDAQGGTITMLACAGGDNGSHTQAGGRSVWTGSGAFSTANECGRRGSFLISATHNVRSLANSASWQTTAPRQIHIVHATVPGRDVLVDSNPGDGYSTTFYWSYGAESISRQGGATGGMDHGSGIDRTISSGFFGWRAVCPGLNPNCPKHEVLDVKDIVLTGVDNTPPALAPASGPNIAKEGGRWIRANSWPASFTASADAGICGTRLIVAGASIPGPSVPPRDPHSWTQCPASLPMGYMLNTTLYPNGSLPVTFSAADAASPANVSSPSETLHIDNTAPALNLVGPTNASSAAGTQYVTATAAATPGLSPLAGISCSVNGGRSSFHPGATAQIPVSGIGPHVVACVALNTAIDPAGQPGTSPLKTVTVLIREPTAAAISFVRIKNALRCRVGHRMVEVPAHPVIKHRKGHTITVTVRPHKKRVRVLHCHARVVTRPVRVKGHLIRKRFVLLPRSIRMNHKRIRFGARTTVSGFLGTARGDALAGQPVRIFAAPNNGSHAFAPVATTTTSGSGNWQATLPPGPSRLVVAVYGGTATLAPTISAAVRLTVPASIQISVAPTVTRWGHTIKINGRLRGGYIPRAGELVVLRIGFRGGSAEVGHLYVRGDGRFSSPYTFLHGSGSATYRLSATTASESDYPYAPTRSRSVTVKVHS